MGLTNSNRREFAVNHGIPAMKGKRRFGMTRAEVEIEVSFHSTLMETEAEEMVVNSVAPLIFRGGEGLSLRPIRETRSEEMKFSLAPQSMSMVVGQELTKQETVGSESEAELEEKELER